MRGGDEDIGHALSLGIGFSVSSRVGPCCPSVGELQCVYVHTVLCVCVCACTCALALGEVCIQDSTCRGWVLAQDGTVLEVPSALFSTVLVSGVSLTNVWLA